MYMKAAKVAPQSFVRFKRGYHTFPPGKPWILAKLLSNLIFLALALFLHLSLIGYLASINQELGSLVDRDRVSPVNPFNYNTRNICGQDSSYQDNTFVRTDFLVYGFYFIYGCLLISTVEILLYAFCHGLWRRLLVGEISDDKETCINIDGRMRYGCKSVPRTGPSASPSHQYLCIVLKFYASSVFYWGSFPEEENRIVTLQVNKKSFFLTMTTLKYFFH